MACSYPFLRFGKGVDWKDVDPKLLSALNQLGAAQHKVIDVISGYRTYEQQAVLYDRYQHGGSIAAKPGQSNHERGAAVDVLINGKPIAKVFSAKLLARYGLVNPVKGDFPHTELLGGSKLPAEPSAPPATSNQTTTDTSMQTVAAPSSLTAGSTAQPDPVSTQPAVYAPGTVPASAFTSHAAQLWQQVVSSSPNPDPESLMFLQNAKSANGG